MNSLTSTFFFLLQSEDSASASQGEYTTVWALVFACIFLGFLAIGIPRIRKTTIAETEAEKKKRLKQPRR